MPKHPTKPDTKGYRKCPNCFGTGTVFRGKTFRGGGVVCPRCKGSCKIVDDPFEPD